MDEDQSELPQGNDALEANDLPTGDEPEMHDQERWFLDHDPEYIEWLESLERQYAYWNSIREILQLGWEGESPYSDE